MIVHSQTHTYTPPTPMLVELSGSLCGQAAAGAIAGTVIGCVLVAVLIATAIALLVIRKVCDAFMWLEAARWVLDALLASPWQVMPVWGSWLASYQTVLENCMGGTPRCMPHQAWYSSPYGACGRAQPHAAFGFLQGYLVCWPEVPCFFQQVL